MKVEGAIFVVNNAETGMLEVIAESHAASPGVFTQCILPDEATALSGNSYTQADDRRYGHGEAVPDATPTQPGVAITRIPIDSEYVSDAWQGRTTTKVAPGAWIRVGFRHRSWKAIEIPKPGQAVRIPFEDMLPGNTLGDAEPWQPVKSNRGVDESSLPAILKSAYTLLQQSKHHVAGEIQIHPVAHPDDPSVLLGWEVWALNTAKGTPKGMTSGFTATIVLLDAAGRSTKNGGIGLESMPCPGPGYSCAQTIEAGGDYGASIDVCARPGTRARLGVRGYSATETTLPSLEEGNRAIRLADFTPTASSSQSSWFDTKSLLKKCSEKKNYIEMFHGDRRINDELPDCIYRGAEAFQRAELKDPPRIRVEWAERDEASGWIVHLESLLPERDAIGKLAFTARARVEGEGVGAELNERFVPHLCTHEARETEWFVPAVDVDGTQLACVHDQLIIETGALGWRGTITLPEPGDRFDSSDSQATLETVWVLRESDFKRASLHPPKTEP